MTPCRLCRSTSLTTVLDLGDLAATGTFPLPGEPVDSGPLRLVVCGDCGLVQLADTGDLAAMYGDGYGYRSGLNASMVAHLSRTTAGLARRYGLEPGDVVLDIGANDGTLLRSWPGADVRRIGIDPTIDKWAEFYDPADGIWRVPRFFSADAFHGVSRHDADIVTSVAMLYDLPDPLAFARDVAAVLKPDGLWHMEVAYAPTMLRTGAYDGICHEHLEYYSLGTLKRILDESGFVIVDVSTNGTNGGSLAVTAAKAGSRWPVERDLVAWMLAQEARQGVGDPLAWAAFADGVHQHQRDLVGLLTALKCNGATISGLGASTKGNVLLQSAGIGTQLLDSIGDVNPDKFGRVTPGTGIPIRPEADVLAEAPDVLVVLPWHFREGFMSSMAGYLARGGRLLFPLPAIEVVGG